MITVSPIPPGLSITEIPAPAAPAPDILARIESLWNDEQRRRGKALENGSMFSLDCRKGSAFTAWKTKYKRWIAQRLNVDLFPTLTIRPLAVCGVTQVAEGFVFGRRSESTTQYPGFWELPPSGGIKPTCRRPEGLIAADAQILAELSEELNVAPHLLAAPPRPFAVMEDDAAHVVDIVFDLRINLNAEELREVFAKRKSREYAELRIIGRNSVAEFLAQEKDSLAATSTALMRYLAADHESSR